MAKCKVCKQEIPVLRVKMGYNTTCVNHSTAERYSGIISATGKTDYALNIIKDPVISNRLIMDKPEAFMVINTALKAQLNKKDPSPTPTGMNIQNKIDKPLTL